MNSKNMGADMVMAWPTAEIAVMGPEGAANIIFKNDIKESADLLQQEPKKFRNTAISSLHRMLRLSVDLLMT